MAKNIVAQNFSVDRSQRCYQNGHKSALLWLTGLSGSGKSTVANIVEKKLHQNNIRTYCLDGDNIRSGISNDLGFKAEDRKENIRRIAEISKLFIDGGIVVIASFISPYRADRKMIEEIVGSNDFHEVYVKAPIETCESRDVKGLYEKARAGEIENFTGITAPYEEPVAPRLVLNTELESAEESATKVVEYITPKLHL